MSRRAVDWASRQTLPHAADKLVLWGLADAHNRDTGRTFPSVAALVAFTGWQRKLVIASLARLAASGMIADTGERIGRTRQVKVWRLACDPETVPERDR